MNGELQALSGAVVGLLIGAVIAFRFLDFEKAKTFNFEQELARDKVRKLLLLLERHEHWTRNELRIIIMDVFPTQQSVFKGRVSNGRK